MFIVLHNLSDGREVTINANQIFDFTAGTRGSLIYTNEARTTTFRVQEEPDQIRKLIKDQREADAYVQFKVLFEIFKRGEPK